MPTELKSPQQSQPLFTKTTRFPTGLYGITPEWDDFSRLFTAIETACHAGLPILQWRRKNTPFDVALEQASMVAKVCKNTGTTFVINDNWQLALAVKADAVHLGKDDASVLTVQKALQTESHSLLIGVSCYNQLELAQNAILHDVDYLAFGAVYPSSVKPNAVRAPLRLFREARDLFSPTSSSPQTLVAIGGITRQNAAPVIQAGADSIAVISGLFEQTDIAQTTKDFIQLFKQNYHD